MVHITHNISQSIKTICVSRKKLSSPWQRTGIQLVDSKFQTKPFLYEVIAPLYKTLSGWCIFIQNLFRFGAMVQNLFRCVQNSYKSNQQLPHVHSKRETECLQASRCQKFNSWIGPCLFLLCCPLLSGETHALDRKKTEREP
jgi:hypothetical protein